ncbi:hypothetical protein GCM10007301_26830 [Azorhizobium oxalatiphilum]|uniref:Phasin domain-containing protein n=1 Tax=Azorhizobium oxalatiphilum TaxID=980631 RepID=A0A917FDS7_9HYPH|nr:hypothetical protein [Azorhizobium oxalatiphilum]GGF65753.1 hypothetical protein GCM10007301_26830 [Azorhizobium oxalatiphilum]
MTDASTSASSVQDSVRSMQDQWAAHWAKFQSGAYQPGAFPTPPLPGSWPISGVQAFWLETPMAVTSHLQKFVAGQVQEQMNVFTALAREDGPANLAGRQSAFLQQSAMAWATEWLELASLVQTRAFAALQKPADAPPDASAYPRAA